MADEIRVTQPAAGPTGSPDVVVNPDPEATVSPDRAAGEPQDPSLARAQIEQTRARMSETIDEIEEVLVRKKERFQDRLDVMAPVRERPMVAAGVVFGAGLLLGLVTGGDDEPSRARAHDRDDAEWEERAEMWERRARRLLRIAQEQEEEIEALAAGRAVRRPAPSLDAEEAERAGRPSRSRDVGDELTERITGYVTDAIRGLFGTSAA